MKTMVQGLRFNRLVLRPLVLAVGFACALPVGAGAAAPAVQGRGPLSPLLAELAKPTVAAKAPAVQDELLGVASEEPGGLIRDGRRVQVTARFDGGAIGALAQLREAGADVVGASREQQTVTLAVAPEDLPAVASVPGVAAVWQARQPIAYGVGEGGCEGGSAISEGLGQLHVDHAREAFNLRGRGITIGVLSDSYDSADEAANGGPIATHAAGDVASNDLPGPASSCADQQLPVAVLAEGGAEGADEGRAMLQIVHDLAPHAQLAFATAFESEDSFAQNIERLARPVSAGGAGAEVIVDDVAWFEEPFFQDGPVAAAIDKVTAEGVTYLTATGNDNLLDGGGHDIASWEASGFRDSGSCPVAVLLSGFNGKHCLDFDPSGESDDTFGITVEAGETLTLDLQWAEPWYGVNTDLDAFLLASGGNVLAESVEGNSGPKGTQRPVEILQWTNSAGSARTVDLAINRFSGGDPRLKFILMENGSGVSATEYAASSGGDVVGPSIFGHAGARSAISVGAVPFNNSGKPERYSSRGPVVHLFAPVAGTAPAAELGSAETIAKPDVAATDCGATTFFASLSAGTWRFCGTSAAAPHAAAVAALLRQAKPALPPDSYRDALVETATPVGAFGPPAVGGGLVNAYAALGSLPGPLEGGDGPSSGTSPLTSAVSGGGSGSAASAVPTAGSGATGRSPASSRAPKTKILRHPRRIVYTPDASVRVGFVFGSDQAGSSFLCKVDRFPFRACRSRFRPRLQAGAHALKVKARSASGLTDPTAASFRFRVESR
jgi:Subtilase family